MELELRDTLREADVPVIHQVRGAFEDLIRGAARGRYFREKSKRTRDGIVPDLRWRDEDGEFVLGDVKTIGFGKTRYWGRSPASTRPVDARAGSVHTDMRSKLRSIDRTILGRSPNGPLELRLSAVGPIRGLVFGAFGEISEEARTLLCYAADATAARTCHPALRIALYASNIYTLVRGVGDTRRRCARRRSDVSRGFLF